MKRLANRGPDRRRALAVLVTVAVLLIGGGVWWAMRDRAGQGEAVTGATTLTTSPQPPLPGQGSTPATGSTTSTAVPSPARPSGVPQALGSAPARALPRMPVTCQVRVAAGGDVARTLAEHPHQAVCLAPGVHHVQEPLRLGEGQILAGEPGAPVILSGGRPLTGWTYDSRVKLWKTAVPIVEMDDTQAQCEDNVHHLCRIRNQLYVNGQHRSWAPTAEAVKPGTAYLDQAAKVVWVAESPQGATLIYTVAPRAIDTSAPNVTVANIVVEYFATPAQFGAIGVGPKSMVQAVEARFNHGAGLKLAFADDAVVRHSYFHDNGQLGVTQYKSLRAMVTDTTIANNNTDGFWIADWESGGIKITESSGTVMKNTVTGNKGVGVWCDIAVHDMTISENTITDNAADGVRYEISKDGAITNNLIRDNAHGMGRGMKKSLWDGGGITVNTSHNVEIAGNRLQGNMHAVSLQARHRGEGPWGTYQFGPVQVHDNTVVLSANQHIGVVWEEGLADRGSTVTFTGNSYPQRSGQHWLWGGDLLTWDLWSQAREAS